VKTYGGMEVYITILGLGTSWSGELHASAALPPLPPEPAPLTYSWTGCWLGVKKRKKLWRKKSLSPPEIHPPVVQAVARRCAYWAIPDLHIQTKTNELYRLSDRHLSMKFSAKFRGQRGCRVVSAAEPPRSLISDF
jgi:hypothetical protein